MTFLMLEKNAGTNDSSSRVLKLGEQYDFITDCYPNSTVNSTICTLIEMPSFQYVSAMGYSCDPQKGDTQRSDSFIDDILKISDEILQMDDYHNLLYNAHKKANFNAKNPLDQVVKLSNDEKNALVNSSFINDSKEFLTAMKSSFNYNQYLRGHELFLAYLKKLLVICKSANILTFQVTGMPPFATEVVNQIDVKLKNLKVNDLLFLPQNHILTISK